MPPPLLVSSVRYTDQATTKVYWVPSIAASTLVPTRAEMNAGTNISGELNLFTSATGGGGGSSGGWTVTPERISTQNITQTFKTEIAGSLSVTDPSLTFFASKTGSDIRSLLPVGTSGFVMFVDGGDIAGNLAQVFPVSVAAVSVVRVDGGRDATKITVNFVLTGSPNLTVTVPA